MQKKFGFQIVANARAGCWYSNSKIEAYFKSTDGHSLNWDFNLKRLNLHFVKLLAAEKGAILVDITRTGKRFPDSLSKTVPIWCCVINCAVAQYRELNSLTSPTFWDTDLHTLPAIVSRNEHAQICILIQSFVRKLLDSSANLKALCILLKKPLRPIWISPVSRMFINLKVSEKMWDNEEIYFIPVICCSASICVNEPLDSLILPFNVGFNYIQGAADDSESWAPGLTHEMFHAMTYDQIDNFSLTLKSIAESKSIHASAKKKRIYNYIGCSFLAIGNRESGNFETCWDNFDIVINCGASEFIGKVPEGKKYLYYPISEGKKGQDVLFESIPALIADLSSVINIYKKVIIMSEEPLKRTGPSILFHCMQGRDRSVAMCLAFLLATQIPNHLEITKRVVENCVMNIQASHPLAQPSRSYIKKVSLYFMKPYSVDKK